MQETRHQFREDLKGLERQVLGGLELVIGQLDRALEAISYQLRRASRSATASTCASGGCS